jgi:hypothetical protein
VCVLDPHQHPLYNYDSDSEVGNQYVGASEFNSSSDALGGDSEKILVDAAAMVNGNGDSESVSKSGPGSPKTWHTTTEQL